MGVGERRCRLRAARDHEDERHEDDGDGRSRDPPGVRSQRAVADRLLEEWYETSAMASVTADWTRRVANR